jgi:hypothetical protein
MGLKQKAFPGSSSTLLLIAGCVIFFGCTASSHAVRKDQVVSLGPMPVVFINPTGYVERHIWVFSGQERVKLIRNASTGQWALERPPIAEFKIERASGNNWHEYKSIYLPANSSFVIYEQAESIWGPVGRPNEFFIFTGTNPTSVSCRPRTPSMSTTLLCSACIELPYMEPTSGPLRLEMTINPGLYIKQGIIYIINYLANPGK